ncbi:MAG: beta-N-acetylhexosaminidase [Actinocatenispora sp.]
MRARLFRQVAAVAAATTTLLAAGILAGHVLTGHDGGSVLAGNPTRQLPILPAASITDDVLPAPVSAHADPHHQFRITSGTVIHAQGASRDAADYLAGLLRRSTGYRIPVVPASRPAPTGISLLLSGADRRVGDQGYQLDIGTSTVVVRARKAAGALAGVQTLHQLLPAAADSATRQAGPWPVPAGHILDYPRYAYRGAMLDVSRHFFGMDTVKKYLDELSEYKINYLHLHLSDDQGWRIAVNDWPELTEIGGATQVGGGTGGYYTQAQYRQIVSYAQKRSITIVPEIDMPGHTNAALHSRADLTCDGVAPPAYTEIGSPNTALCVGKDLTYTFIDTVIGQLAALTPGPYLHIGGDEAYGVDAAEYKTFIDKVAPIVREHGKTLLGWDQIIGGTLQAGDVAEDWDTDSDNADLAEATHHGVKLIMSPASHVYLDQKYNKDTPIGLHWAGYVEVKDSYSWDPATFLTGADPDSVLGVEAPLWSETIDTLDDIQYLAFPRLTSAAELGWSPRSTHDWTAFSHRLGAQAPRWTVQDVNFYHSPQVPWVSADN